MRIGNRTQAFELYHFQWPWVISNRDFKVTPLFDTKYLRNGARHRHSYNEILIGTYTRPAQWCHFEWSWMTLCGFAKYSMIRSIARSLCDSWASCIVSNQHSLLFECIWKSLRTSATAITAMLYWNRATLRQLLCMHTAWLDLCLAFKRLTRK